MKILLGYFEKDSLEFSLGTLDTRQTHSKKYQNTGEKSFAHNIHNFCKNKHGNSFLIIVSHHGISHIFCKNKCGNSFFIRCKFAPMQTVEFSSLAVLFANRIEFLKNIFPYWPTTGRFICT